MKKYKENEQRQIDEMNVDFQRQLKQEAINKKEEFEKKLLEEKEKMQLEIVKQGELCVKKYAREVEAKFEMEREEMVLFVIF